MELYLHDNENEEIELEDLQLPPLNIRSEFEEYLFNTNSIFVYNEQASDINNYYPDSTFSIEELTSSVEMGTEKQQMSYSDSEQKKDENNLSIKKKNCDYCQKKNLLKNMFIIKETIDSNITYICLKCSSNICESRMLKDWEKEPKSIDTKICRRCNKEKSYYRFNNDNKYCDYCLLKKKWSRLRRKVDFDYANDYSNDDEDEIIPKTNKQYVYCCFCNERTLIEECFLYFECYFDTFSNKKICLNCSLKIKDWRCLRDWEDSAEVRSGKVCSRCKKVKSSCRFKNGKSGCEYCSLKRKRLYLLQKQQSD